jgi:hypothetical protein
MGKTIKFPIDERLADDANDDDMVQDANKKKVTFSHSYANIIFMTFVWRIYIWSYSLYLSNKWT